MNFIWIAIGILCILMSRMIAAFDDANLDPATPRFRNRCPFIKTSLKNGRVKIRSRGRIAKFICDGGYELVGSRFATCVRGEWNKPVPICVTTGCPLIKSPSNGQHNASYKGGLVAFTCDPGYVLKGSASIYCDGITWDNPVPTCETAIENPKQSCDFEDFTLCGWTNDRNHDFDWRRHQFSTPSGHVGTGPSYDHTLGKGKAGYYMYIEASSPQKQNDTARLFSPVYSSDLTPGCFVFWYHMYGATTGFLRVFMKKESQMFSELTPVWEKDGEQGNLWLQSSLSIPKLKEKFQIIIEAIRGNSYVGDTAVDDVALYSTPCEELTFINITKEYDSCQGRCNVGMEENSTCYCSEDCVLNSTCCDDYENFCTKTANRTFILGPEPQPKPFTTTNQAKFSPPTFTTPMATEESTNIPKLTSIAPTVNATFQPYISTSNDFTKLTTLVTSLLNSTFTIAASSKFDTTSSSQTDLGNTSSSPFITSNTSIPNKTTILTKLEETTEPIKLTETTTISTKTENSSYPIVLDNSTASSTNLNEKQITESSTVDQQAKTVPITDFSPTIKWIKVHLQTDAPENTTPQLTTQNVTFQEPTVTSKKTLKPKVITTKRISPKTTRKQASTTEQTTFNEITAKELPQIINTTENVTTNKKETTPIEVITTTQMTSIEQLTTTQKTTIEQLTTTKKTTIEIPTIQQATTQESTVGTTINTTPIITTVKLKESNPTEKTITKQETTTKKSILTKSPKVTITQKKLTKRPITITRKSKTTQKIPDPTSASTQKTTQQAVTKATRKIMKTTAPRLPVTKPQRITITQSPTAAITTETTLPTKKVINRTSVKMLTPTTNKKTTLPTRSTIRPTTRMIPITSKQLTSPSSTPINSKKPQVTTAKLKPTRTLTPKTTLPVTYTTKSKPKITKKTTSSQLTERTASGLKTLSQVKITQASTTATPLETSVYSVYGEISKPVSNIDYSSRSRKKSPSRRPSKANSSSSHTVVIGVAVGIAITVLFLIAVMCFKKRKVHQNKLAEDSEMRFLSDNEILEYSDPSLSVSVP